MFMWTRALVVVLVAACGAASGQVASPKAVVMLTEPGALPRQRLRYQPASHAAERLELSMKLRVSSLVTNTVLETSRRDVDFPTVVVIGRVDASPPTPTGDVTVTFEIEKVTTLDDAIDPKVQRDTADHAAKLEHSRSTWQLAPTGQVSNWVSNIETSAVRSGQDLRDVLRDTQVVFPDEEVGIGATWQATSRHTVSGVIWNRKATYKVRDLTATMVTLDVEVAWQAPSQALRAEPNRTTRLTGGTGVTTGSLTIPLRGLVPTGTARGTSESNLLVTDRHLRISSAITSETILSVRPAP